MADEYLVKKTDMDIVANAIIAKGGTSAPLEFPQGMADAVAAIEGGGDECDAHQQLLARIAGRPYSVTVGDVDSFAPRCFAQDKLINSIKAGRVGIISNSAFYFSALESFVAKSIRKIDINAFKSQNMVRFDSGDVGEIGTGAFSGCIKLTEFILRGATVTIAQSDPVTNTPISQGTGYIYVPKALVEQYKTATNWAQYAAQFRAIEDYPDITGGTE